MVREVEHHRSGSSGNLNANIAILPIEESVGAGGAPSSYFVLWFSGSTLIQFQAGSPSVAGLNGLTNEALLAVLIDRLECFQKGPFPCKEN